MNETDIRRFDLNLLLTLHVLLEERSVSRAARRLFVSQSAVSHALARLRLSLRDPLFHRGLRAMTPTPRAEALQEEVKAILSRADQLIAPLVFDISKHAGVFRIAATDYGSMLIFPALLRHLLESAPNVTLECHAWNDQTLSLLECGLLDLALGGQSPFPALRNQTLFKDKLVLMVDERHPLAARRSITVDELIAYPHAVIDVAASRMKVIDDRLSARHLARRVAIRIPHFLTAPSIIRGSNLILTIPLVGARQLVSGAAGAGFRLLPVPFRIPEYNYIQVWSARRDEDPFHRWMRTTIQSACAAKML